jgi:hypothetical protein
MTVELSENRVIHFPLRVDWKACTPRMTAFISKMLMER